jgi:hypothetical protein
VTRAIAISIDNNNYYPQYQFSRKICFLFGFLATNKVDVAQEDTKCGVTGFCISVSSNVIVFRCQVIITGIINTRLQPLIAATDHKNQN